MSFPQELIYKITYLGGEMFNYSLNFSKPSGQILLQYYSFLRLGRAGYRQVMSNIMENARYLEKMLLATGRFELLNESKYLPVVVVKLKDPQAPPETLYHLSDVLRQHGWIVPAYPLPANAQAHARVAGRGEREFQPRPGRKIRRRCRRRAEKGRRHAGHAPQAGAPEKAAARVLKRRAAGRLSRA